MEPLSRVTYSDMVITIIIVSKRVASQGSKYLPSSSCQSPLPVRIEMDRIDGLAFRVPLNEKWSGFHGDGIGEWPLQATLWRIKMAGSKCEVYLEGSFFCSRQ